MMHTKPNSKKENWAQIKSINEKCSPYVTRLTMKVQAKQFEHPIIFLFLFTIKPFLGFLSAIAPD